MFSSQHSTYSRCFLHTSAGIEDASLIVYWQCEYSSCYSRRKHQNLSWKFAEISQTWAVCFGSDVLYIYRVNVCSSRLLDGMNSVSLVGDEIIKWITPIHPWRFSLSDLCGSWSCWMWNRNMEHKCKNRALSPGSRTKFVMTTRRRWVLPLNRDTGTHAHYQQMEVWGDRSRNPRLGWTFEFETPIPKKEQITYTCWAMHVVTSN